MNMEEFLKKRKEIEEKRNNIPRPRNKEKT